jgi:hypothetical protein
MYAMGKEKVAALRDELLEINAVQEGRDNVHRQVLKNLEAEEEAVIAYETKKEFLKKSQEAKDEARRKAEAAASKKARDAEAERQRQYRDYMSGRGDPFGKRSGKQTLTLAEYEAKIQERLDEEKFKRDVDNYEKTAKMRKEIADQVHEYEVRLAKERKQKQQRMWEELRDYGIEQIRATTDFAISEIVDRNAIEIRLAEARKRGDDEAVADLEEQRLQAEETVAARVLERLSMEAMGTGAKLFAEGIAAAAMGNPGGFVAAGIGAALFTAGASGTIASGSMLARAGAAAETREYNRRDDPDPPGAAGPGRQVTGGATVVNYYFGGPVFGNRDDAARAVRDLNKRGAALGG